MANHKNAEKCIRKTLRRTIINTRRRTIMRGAVKKAEISLGMREMHGHKEKVVQVSPEQITELVRAAESRLMRAAQQGVISKKTASRKVSRLTKKMKKLSA
jgi:small subunit ribosomal protein S20